MIDKNNWTPENLAWMAGLMEGEGSFMIDRDKHLKISCEMRDEDVILKLQRLAGFGNIWAKDARVSSPRDLEKGRSRENHSIMYRWYSGVSKDIYEFEMDLLPYMGERRAAKILETHNTRREYEITASTRVDSDGRRLGALRRVFPDAG